MPRRLLLLKRTLLALPFVALGVVASTGSAMAAFDPTPDELSVGTLILVLAAMGLLTLIYGVIWYFDLNHPGEVEIPDHAHDHRYAGHH
jgi:hypothetical protein